MTAESWRPIEGYGDRYAVSDLGGVRSETRFVRHPRGGLRELRGRCLVRSAGGDGYLYVTLCADAVCRTFAVHLLVLAAFRGARPEGLEARHLNGVRKDARLNNLVWGTHAENLQDKVRHGTHLFGERHQNAKLTEAQVRAIAADRRPHVDVALDLGVSPRTIADVRSGRSWSAVLNRPVADQSIHHHHERKA